jgi:hypothetical protein
MIFVVVLTHLLLAATFIVSGLAKLITPAGTRRAIAELRAPVWLVAPLSWGLPLVELILAGALLTERTGRWAAVAAALFLTGVSVPVARALRRGERPRCNCFGTLSRSGASSHTLARNGALVLVAVLGAARNVNVAGTIATTGSTRDLDYSLVAVAALEAWAIWQLVLQNRRLVLSASRPEGEERPVPARRRPSPLPAGAPAPGFDLPCPEGGRRSLQHLLALGPEGAVLVFVAPGCPGCQTVIDHIATLPGPGPLAIAVLARRGASELSMLLGRDGATSTVLECDAGVAAAYGVTMVPAAIMVDTGGRSGAPMAVGADDVVGMLGGRRAVQMAGR